MIFFHDLLYCKGCKDDNCLARVMAFTMTRRTLNNRIFIGHAWFLGSFGYAVNITSQSNNRTATAPLCHPGGWDTGYAFFNSKTIFLKNARNVFGSFYFLEAQLSETEDHIHHFLHTFFF